MIPSRPHVLRLQILWRFNYEAAIVRVMFLANSPRGGPSHTVLVTDIPAMPYGTVKWYVRTVSELMGWDEWGSGREDAVEGAVCISFLLYHDRRRVCW